ncbi:helix-turn-helix domain-containing protein [Flavobacterium sp.]|uniref:helix-turn-helix domain-containing protein n=1 Tax=Flavobacterium sp. TaxID=239 RepID=UPI003BDF2FCF
MSNSILKDSKRITLEDTPREILLIREQLEDLKVIIMDIKQNFTPKEPEELMSREQVAEMFKVDPSTVHNWAIQGRIIKYGIENTVRYKRSEINQSLKPIKQTLRLKK